MTMYKPAVETWRGEGEPLAIDIESRMRNEGLEPFRWANPAGYVFAPHSHPYHKVLFVLHGSIRFGFPATGRHETLEPGDRLDLPPGVVHDAVVGLEGVVCLEGHRR